MCPSGLKRVGIKFRVYQASLDVIALDICLAQVIMDQGLGSALKVLRFRLTGKLCVL